MKKAISLILAIVMCLALCACGSSEGCSCDCAQCVQCENKTHNTEATDVSHPDNVPETTEPNNNVMEFETPIVVAEDEHLRVEVVKFYQEYRLWNTNGYPLEADSSTEGATLESFVVFKFYNKSNRDLRIEIDSLYLGSDGAHFSQNYASKPAVGKNVTGHYLIQTGEKEALASMEELYSLDGKFEVYFQGEDGVLRDRYELKFSIPNGLDRERHAVQNTAAWEQFRNYLQTHGPVTLTVEKTETGENQFAVEATPGGIQVSYLGVSSVVSGKVRARGQSTSYFDLPANAKTVNVYVEYTVEGNDENGVHNAQSASGSYTWDIQNYRPGDEISFAVDLTVVEGNQSEQKPGTLTATKSFRLIAEALSQALAESGLGITMADLGFTNY